MAVTHINTSTSAKVLSRQFHDALGDPTRSREPGTEWLRNSIAIFENKYGMSSMEMVRQVRSGAFEETDDICSWLIKAELLRDVESEF